MPPKKAAANAKAEEKDPPRQKSTFAPRKQLGSIEDFPILR
jgi:hypothetical protein